MKKFLFIISIAFFPQLISAQINDGQVSFAPIVNNEDIPDEALKALTNKLSRAIAINGYGTLNNPERFVLVANIDVSQNDIIPSTPPRVSKKMDISMIVGDVIENKTFSSCCVSVSGVGTSDNKAFISAFSQLNPTNRAIKQMFDDATTELHAYYANADLFLTKAHSYSSTGEYDKAIAYLMTVPPIDKATYDACQTEMASIYQEKINHEGQALLNSAKGKWNSSRNLSGAKEAAKILDKINPDSSVMPDVDQLWLDISNKLRVDELAAIEAQKRAHEERMQQAAINAETAGHLIDAAKAVGIAFGVFQPRVVINRFVRRWF